MSKSEQVLKMLKKIPRGKVTTYGELSKASKSSPRAIGQIMRNNKQPEKYPCYKVVKSTGEIGGYDGCINGKMINKKILLLKKDGIKIENGKIDLKRFKFSF